MRCEGAIEKCPTNEKKALEFCHSDDTDQLPFILIIWRCGYETLFLDISQLLLTFAMVRSSNPKLLF